MKRKSLKRLATLCLVVTALVLAPISTSSAQAQYVSEVRGQLNAIRAKIEDYGFEKTHEYKIARLSRGRVSSFTLTLRKDVQYVLASMCDSDCTDLDIKIYDEDNNQVASDTAVDDRPVVAVTPRWTGQFRIQVRMYKCSTSSCYYGIGIFGK